MIIYLTIIQWSCLLSCAIENRRQGLGFTDFFLGGGGHFIATRNDLFSGQSFAKPVAPPMHHHFDLILCNEIHNMH